MSLTRAIAAYDELLDALADCQNVQTLTTFRLSAKMQSRLDGLLEKRSVGDIDDSERSELNTYEVLERVVRDLKARLVRKRQ